MTESIESPGSVSEIRTLMSGLISEGATVATAESITGGRLVAALTSVPGASAVVRGAVVAYAIDIKASMLGVDPAVLDEQGPVSAPVAEQMATGVRERMTATYGVATTGEAGPDSASGRSVGTVYVAVAGPGGTTTRRLQAPGTREQVQQGAVAGALALLAAVRGAGPGEGDALAGAEIGNNDG